MSSTQKNNLRANYFIISVVTIQLVVYIVVILDVPLARQVIGFLYLTFVPGFVLLKILKVYKIGAIEKMVFSVGLSIALWMLIGFFVNELSPIIYVFEPLSQTNLILISSGTMALLVFSGYLIDRDLKFSRKTRQGAEFSLKLLIYLSVVFCLPLLSVFGTTLVNASGDNFVLLLMMLLVSGLIFSIAIYGNSLSKFYPLLLISIGVALLFHKSLVSNLIHGFDIHREYYVFRLTEVNLRWNPGLKMGSLPRFSTFNSMLSITVLPTIYSGILNIEGSWIFKLVYPLIFSFVPLGLYKLYRTQMKEKIAFLSTFFYMANDIFLQPTSNAKQMIAELFYVLLFFVLFNKKLNPWVKRIFFILFSFGLVVSHYSSSYIFLFLISFTVLFMFLMEKVFHKKKLQNITVFSVASFFVITFAWYIYVSYSGPFSNLVETGDYIFRSVSREFFNPQSRGERVLTGLGMTSPPSFWHAVSRMYFYIAEFLILVGFVVMMIGKKKISFDQEYKIIIGLSLCVLLMAVVLPGFAGALRMERFYHFSLIFLAPLYILGGRILFTNVLKLKTTKSCDLFLISILLVPFFLFQYGFVFEVTRDPVPSSFSLSKYRWGEEGYNSMGLIHEREIFGGVWLSEYVAEGASIYADTGSLTRVLRSGYVMIPPNQTRLLSVIGMKLNDGSYIYLRQYNVKNGIIITIQGQFNITELPFVLNNLNSIYTNGGCEIYKDADFSVLVEP